MRKLNGHIIGLSVARDECGIGVCRGSLGWYGTWRFGRKGIHIHEFKSAYSDLQFKRGDAWPGSPPSGTIQKHVTRDFKVLQGPGDGKNNGR